MKSKNYTIRVLLWNLFILILTTIGCKKFIEVDSPVTSVNGQNVYLNDNTAISVLTGMYANMAGNGLGGFASISVLPELSADNLRLYNPSLNNLSPFYQNDLSATIQSNLPGYWTWCYQGIYQTNAAIEGLNLSNTLTPQVKSQLLGEAFFMRAFFFYYLVNLYGDVPLVLTTDYKTNSDIGRSASSKVYDQIIVDLKNAQSHLNDDYMDLTLLKSTSERIRPNKGAATALLARTYLFAGDYINAEAQASLLIDNNPKYKLDGLDDVFKKNSDETIWSLQPVRTDENTWEAIFYILPSTGPDDHYPAVLSDQLIQNFDNTDQRLSKWTKNVTVEGVTYYYPFKYKVGNFAPEVSEYSVVFRLAEQYLIRAEARAQQNKLIGPNSASGDLNIIRARAGLLPTTALSKQQILDEILNERRSELFTEWGHRWFDLKRSGKIDVIMNSAVLEKGPGVTWQPFKSLYPIPQTEIKLNSGLTGQQNPGYN